MSSLTEESPNNYAHSPFKLITTYFLMDKIKPTLPVVIRKLIAFTTSTQNNDYLRTEIGNNQFSKRTPQGSYLLRHSLEIASLVPLKISKGMKRNLQLLKRNRCKVKNLNAPSGKFS